MLFLILILAVAIHFKTELNKQNKEFSIKFLRQQWGGASFPSRDRTQKNQADVAVENEIKEKKIELTVRMPAQHERDVKHFLCMMLPTAFVHWDRSYGNFHLILDQSDKETDFFDKITTFFGRYFSFRVTYEPEPVNLKRFEQVNDIIKRGVGKFSSSLFSICNNDICDHIYDFVAPKYCWKRYYMRSVYNLSILLIKHMMHICHL